MTPLKVISVMKAVRSLRIVDSVCVGKGFNRLQRELALLYRSLCRKGVEFRAKAKPEYEK